MITLTDRQLDAWLAQLFWPFVRIGSCFMVAPAFGASFGAGAHPDRARRRRRADRRAAGDRPRRRRRFSARRASLITVQQVVIGVALGFCLQILFDAVTLGGQLLANSMGLSFAFNLDPQSRRQHPDARASSTRILVTLIFLALNGHLRSSQCWSTASTPCRSARRVSAPNGLWSVVIWGSELFSGALAVALPGVTALLIVNLAFGVVSRAAPTLNLFAVGLPLSLVFGLVVLLASLPALRVELHPPARGGARSSRASLSGA